MARLKTFDLMALALVGFVGIYTGTQFFEPIVIERLKRDGNLRQDIEIPVYDEEGNPIDPKSILQLKTELNRIQETQKSEARDETFTRAE
ncbi:LAMI_0A02520g1_1 [Lachancea mirantina]|uniref:LAMI_0A02520g1_1 n=1 Tax=Lachancea mirantina TaxID=1230905 RepID=A0A1G4IMI3_9SACH|nr:LAMI_0A02520g1_1 [Lachancea mirantina]